MKYLRLKISYRISKVCRPLVSSHKAVFFVSLTVLLKWNFVIWRNSYDFFTSVFCRWNSETEQKKNLQTERVNQFFLQAKRCTQFSASKFSTLQIANRWRCYHHYVLSCAPSCAKSTKPSLIESTGLYKRSYSSFFFSFFSTKFS